MSQSTPTLDLPFIQPSQAQKHVTHNEALRRLDMVVQLRLQNTQATIPPAVVEDGETYGLGPSSTGDWAGKDGMLATWIDTAWHFVEPQIGWRAWDLSIGRLTVWNGTDWVMFRPDLDSIESIGIGTNADETNRLAVRAPATLLSHEGQGHQLKVAKSTEADTASLLFQSDWVGHAEMGLAGQNAFSIKVSADGADWTEALRLDDVTGRASGSAVQAFASDAAIGKLLVTGAFGLGETGTGPMVSDIDALDTPSGIYRYIATTSGADNLPLELHNSSGLIRIERFNGTLLRQTAWRNNFVNGIWTRTHISGAWGSWRMIYDQSTILGTVSHTAGQPSGAIFERGETAEGDYVRFADGTQTCTRRFDTATDTHTWNFPVSFSPAGHLSVQALARHSTAPRIVTEGEDLTETGVTLKVWDNTGAAAPAPVYATATGRWF